jgi:hypothetical protein
MVTFFRTLTYEKSSTIKCFYFNDKDGNGFNSLNGENNGGNNGGRGHGGGHGTDSNTAHSGREDTRLGPLSDT